MRSSVACGVSSPAEQARQRAAESGDRSSARPKKELRRKQASEARFSRRGNRQRMRRQTRQRLRSKTRLPERNLRVTLPAWLEGRRSQESGNFVHESRAGTKEPKKDGNRKRRPGRRCGGRPERGQRRRLRSWAMVAEGRRQKRRQSSGRCSGRSKSGISSAAWPMMRDPNEIGKGTEGLAGRRKRTAATEDSSSGTPDGV